MKINVVIGAGQLGSRHLQGLLRLTIKQKIFVLEPSEVSLELSKTRANEIPNEHEIIFSKDWDILPQNLDLVIIATGANVRAMLIEKLLPKYKVKNLVLEKILFQMDRRTQQRVQMHEAIIELKEFYSEFENGLSFLVSKMFPVGNCFHTCGTKTATCFHIQVISTRTIAS